jgi:hypothetical protein
MFFLFLVFFFVVLLERSPLSKRMSGPRGLFSSIQFFSFFLTRKPAVDRAPSAAC